MDAHVVTKERQGLNKNTAQLTQMDIDPLALQASQRLILRHSPKSPVLIKSWGTPDIVYAHIREDLIRLGYKIGMAEYVAESLVEQARVYAEDSRQKYSARLIGLKIEVSKAEPPPQFETGAIEVLRIDGHSPHGQIVGATSVAIGFTTSGTTTTALRDSVSEILKSFDTTHQSVWIHFEAPNKSELKGIAHDAVLSVMAELSLGVLSPERMKEIIQQIQALMDAGLIPPEMMGVIENLNGIHALTRTGDMAGVQDLISATMERLSLLAKADGVPADLVRAGLQTFDVIVQKNGIQNLVEAHELSILRQTIEVALTIEKLEQLSFDPGSEQTIALQALIEELKAAEGSEIISVLDTLKTELSDTGLPPEQVMPILNQIELARATTLSTLPLDIHLGIVAQSGAPDVMALLQELSQMENLPPELTALIEKLDLKNMTVDELQSALVGQTALSATVQQVVVALGTPQMQALLPPSALPKVQTFIDQLAMSELTQTLRTIDPELSEASPAQNIIDKLERGQPADLTDLKNIETLTEKGGAISIRPLTSIVPTSDAQDLAVPDRNMQQNGVSLPASSHQTIGGGNKSPSGGVSSWASSAPANINNAPLSSIPNPSSVTESPPVNPEEKAPKVVPSPVHGHDTPSLRPAPEAPPIPVTPVRIEQKQSSLPLPESQDSGVENPAQEGHTHGVNCGCKNVFNQASQVLQDKVRLNPALNYEGLKETVAQSLANTRDTSVAVTDVMLAQSHQLSSHQRTQFIQDIAQNHFNGDAKKAEAYVKGHEALREIEAYQAPIKEQEQTARDEARRAMREARKQEASPSRVDEFNKKGCPEHGEGCKGHGIENVGEKITASENKKSARQRGLKL